MHPLPSELTAVLRQLPENHQQLIRAAFLDLYEHQLWQGPLPPPEMLKLYNDAFPNGAERIFTEVQRQATHRIELEKRLIPEQLRQSERGQLFGLVVALSFLIAAFVLVALGHGLYGTIIGSIDLVALVTVFVIGRREQDRVQRSGNG